MIDVETGLERFRVICMSCEYDRRDKLSTHFNFNTKKDIEEKASNEVVKECQSIDTINQNDPEPEKLEIDLTPRINPSVKKASKSGVKSKQPRKKTKSGGKSKRKTGKDENMKSLIEFL